MKATFLFIVYSVITPICPEDSSTTRPPVKASIIEEHYVAAPLKILESPLSRTLFKHPKREVQNELFRLISLENCFKTLLHIHTLQLRSTDCCLTRICWNHTTHNDVWHKYPQLKELSLKLCGETVYLRKEQQHGCSFGDNLNSYVNNDTNFTTMVSNKENPAIANCSVNFKTATINDETSQINFEIAGNLKKRSTETKSNTTSGDFLETSDTNSDEKTIRFENITKTFARNAALQFLDVPKGDDMRIHDLRLEEEYLLFEAFSFLMGYLQPVGFPSELLRDLLQNHAPLQLVIFQLLKLEIMVVGWILLWAILALCLPFAVAAHMCCPSGNLHRLNEYSSNASVDISDKWTGRSLGIILHMLLLLLLCPIILILGANEQISRSITKLPVSVDIVYEDVNTFIRNTHMQISFVATSSTDIAIEAIRKDLEDVETLLGKPFQQELISQTGIDIALDNLEELKMSTGKVTWLVSELLKECESARAAGSLLQEQLREVARQLTITRQQCNPKDRVLCYTLQNSGFEVTFSTVNLTTDLKIKHLERIGREQNFNSSIENARRSFTDIPERVSVETAPHIADIKNLLSRKRTEVYKSAHALDELTRSLSESVRVGRDNLLTLTHNMAGWDLWRWLAVLGVATILSLIWGLLLCGAPCGCGLTSRTIPFLLSGVSLSCLICLVVWVLGTVSFLIGGHSQSFVCQTLYDQPRYRALAELLNSGGILYNEEGFFKAFIKGNDSLRVEDVLKNCQRDQPVYNTFHLYNQLNVNTVTNYKTWDDLHSLFSNLTFAESHLEILSPSLQLNLQVLATMSNVNLTMYRTKITGSVTRRDLNSFADQLNTVARQLGDPVSSRKIDNLAYIVRKVIQNEMLKLEGLRNRILYKITALEVLMLPLNKQANQSLSHLKTIQFFLDNQGWQIAEQSGRQFTSRIENNLEGLYKHIYFKATKEIGKCRPLWEIFHSARFYVCKLIVDPMNGISFSCFFLILLFLAIAPVVIKLVDYYKETNEEILSSISHRRTRDGLIIDDEGTWATPSSETPDVPLRQISTSEQTTWITPRQPSEPLVPPPPRPPSSISSRIQSSRVPEIPSISRAKTPKSKLASLASRITAARVPQMASTSRARSPRRGLHESLRLIEPVCWKSGSTSPRSWI